VTNETFPEDMAASAAYSNWRRESNRAEREFRQSTKKPRADLETTLEEIDRRRKEKIAAAKREVLKASSIHRTDVELARIEYRKAIHVAEATLKEAMARARTPVRTASEKFRSECQAANREATAAEEKGREAFQKLTAPAYAERKRVKQESWHTYEAALKIAHEALLAREANGVPA
jgi:hypothetical protein